MDKKWITLSISGVTNGGKTTLTTFLKRILPNITTISQDSYFLPKDSPKHILVPELNHFNWEVLSSLDMEKMHEDILKILQNKTIKIPQLQEDTIENVFYSKTLSHEDLLSLRSKLKPYNLLIIEDKDACYARRCSRIYDPPDVPGYFDKIVWPEHLKQLQEVKEKCKDVIFLTQDNDNHLGTIVKHLLLYL